MSGLGGIKKALWWTDTCFGGCLRFPVDGSRRTSSVQVNGAAADPPNWLAPELTGGVWRTSLRILVWSPYYARLLRRTLSGMSRSSSKPGGTSLLPRLDRVSCRHFRDRRTAGRAGRRPPGRRAGSEPQVSLGVADASARRAACAHLVERMPRVFPQRLPGRGELDAIGAAWPCDRGPVMDAPRQVDAPPGRVSSRDQAVPGGRRPRRRLMMP